MLVCTLIGSFWEDQFADQWVNSCSFDWLSSLPSGTLTHGAPDSLSWGQMWCCEINNVCVCVWGGILIYLIKPSIYTVYLVMYLINNWMNSVKIGVCACAHTQGVDCECAGLQLWLSAKKKKSRCLFTLQLCHFRDDWPAHHCGHMLALSLYLAHTHVYLRASVSSTLTSLITSLTYCTVHAAAIIFVSAFQIYS